MEVISSSPTTVVDVVDLIEKLATLNLGYLGIAVTILALIGAAFYFFNFKPLKEALERQKKAVDGLEKEVKASSAESQKKLEQDLGNFEQKHTKDINSLIEQQNNLLISNTKTQIATFEKDFSERIDNVTGKKDSELKTVILSEVDNKTRLLERSLVVEINKVKDFLNKQILSQKETIDSLNRTIKYLKRNVRELEVYKYSNEGKMGAIYGSIDLLKEDIDDKNDYSIPDSLERLKKEIAGTVLKGDVITRIEEQLTRIETDKKYTPLLEDVRSQYIQNKNK